MTEILDQPAEALAPEPETIRKVSIVISKGSLEGVYPGLIMANGARMEGIEANVFFTFLASTRSAKGAATASRSRPSAIPGCTCRRWSARCRACRRSRPA